MIIHNKRAAGHIEFVLSTVLFIAFVVAILFFFIPRGQGNSIEDSVSYIQKAINNFAKDEITVYGIKLNQTNIAETKTGVVGILLPSYSGGERVEDISGNKISSGKVGDVIYVSPSGNNFLYIILSEDLPLGSLSGGAVDSRNYEISSLIVEKLISENKFKKFLEDYASKYEDIKSSMNLPNQIDFAVELNFDDGSSLKSDFIPNSGSDIFVKSFRENIIRLDGKREFGDLRIKIW